MKKLLPLLFLLCFTGNALGAGNIHYGSLEIHPYLNLSEYYTDNVFATETDAEHDWVTTITPGIKLQFPFRAHKLTLDYYAVLSRYANFDSENTTNHNANAIADFKLGSRFGLTLSDKYERGHEARSNSATGQVENYETNAATLSAKYMFVDRANIRLDYTGTIWNFKQSDYRDRQEHFLAAYFYYRFLPKTSAFVEYDYNNISYSQKEFSYGQKEYGLDSAIHTGFLGLTWEASEHTKGTIKGGYMLRDFEDSNMEDMSTWAVSANLAHSFSEYSFLRLIGSRVANETKYIGASSYVTTSAFADYMHKITYKITLVMRGQYGIDDYSNVIESNTEERRDKTYMIGGGVKYQMRDWVEFVLDYNHWDRDSSIAGNDMKNNIYSLSINFSL
ncbi:MAG: outer membrane beta-barrel protein [Deltaproteobacteria bacterium]|nr:outer membrane beta-barrel protein [Deltaproteobacteria bacterium]